MEFKAFEATPGISVIVLPDSPFYTHVAVSNDFIRALGMKREDVIGKGHFEVLPKSPDDSNFTGEQNLRASFEHIIQHKEPHEIPIQRYDIPNSDGTFSKKYWKFNNAPILNDAGQLLYIVHSALDITSQVVAEQKSELSKGIEKAYNFFINAPVIIGFLKGRDYVIELANEGLLEVWGRTSDVIGKPLMQAIPELEGQGFKALLDQVCVTGEPFYAYEYPITLHRHGKNEVLYFDFVYKPFYENGTDAKASGIFSVGHDVTAQVLARQKVKESEEKYRSLFESMDQGFCIIEMLFDAENKPVDYRFLEYNPVFEKQTGLKDAMGKTARELIPNLEPHWFDLYGKVALTGEPIRFTEGSDAISRWFDVYAYPIGGADSRKVAILFTDITERRKGEEALKQSEANLRNMITHSPVAMCLLQGPSFVVELANDRIFEIWGKRSEEMLHKPVFEGLPEAAKLGLEREMQRVYTTGKSFIANELAVPLPRNGAIETTYLNFIYEAYRSGDGTITGIIAVATEVTDQVVARMKIEESQRDLQNMVLQSPIGICVIDAATLVSEIVNDSFIEVAGKDRDAIVGKRYWDTFAETRAYYEAALSQVIASGVPYQAHEVELMLIRHGKEEIVYVTFVFAPMKDVHGAVKKVAIWVFDNTPQVTSRKKIEDAEQKARLAIESADLGTYEINVKTNETITSPRFQAIWEMANTSDRNAYAKMIHPDDFPIREKAIAEAFTTGNLYYEVRLITGAEKIKWVRVTGMVLFDHQHKPDRLLGVLQDITEQKLFAEELAKQVREQTEELMHAHLALLKTNDYLQSIINVFNVPLQVLQPIVEDGNVVDFRYRLTNDAYAAYANTTPKALENKRVGDIFPGYFQTDSFIKIAETYKRGVSNTWENHYNVDGLDIYNEMRATVMGDEVVVHFTDFTTLKNLQLDLMHKVEELERSNQNLEEFAHAASHDLKEPIRKVHVFSNMLKRSFSSLDEEQQRLFERVEDATQRMGQLIDDLLEYSHVSMGVDLLEEIDLNKKVQTVLADLELVIKENGAKITVSTLPTIKGHRRQLQQLFHNLIQNSLKYSKKDMIPQVVISSELVTGIDTSFNLTEEKLSKFFHLISIKDNGIGFEQEHASQIFQMFKRLHGKGEYTGSGVGLAIVKKVVENHNGYIRAKGKTGEGAVFEILLPAF